MKKEEILKIIDEYDQKCKTEGPIKLKFVGGKEKELNQDSLEDFIKDFILTNHAVQIKNPQEIEDFLGIDGKSQCKLNARRSIGDIYRIALAHYNKPVSLLEVMEAGYKVIRNNYKEPINGLWFTSFMCGTIGKRTFCLFSSPRYNFEKENSSNAQNAGNQEFQITGEEYYALFGQSFDKKQKETEVLEVVEELI